MFKAMNKIHIKIPIIVEVWTKNQFKTVDDVVKFVLDNIRQDYQGLEYQSDATLNGNVVIEHWDI